MLQIPLLRAKQHIQAKQEMCHSVAFGSAFTCCNPAYLGDGITSREHRRKQVCVCLAACMEVVMCTLRHCCNSCLAVAQSHEVQGRYAVRCCLA